MPAQSLQTEAIVLLKRPPTDSFQTLNIFSADHGGVTILQRVPKSRPARADTSARTAGHSVALDLFDEAAFLLESSNQGRTWFVKEARLLHRHTGIGRSYDALRLASALSALVVRNPVHEESRAIVAKLLRAAFGAFASGTRPDIVYFKSLYCFARDEGYPVKQQWFPTLPAADRTAVADLLNRPLGGQIATPAAVNRLQLRLEEYLRGHTEILLD